MPIDFFWLLTLIGVISVGGVIATMFLRRQRRRSALIQDKHSQVTSWENEGGAQHTPPADSATR